ACDRDAEPFEDRRLLLGNASRLAVIKRRRERLRVRGLRIFREALAPRNVDGEEAPGEPVLRRTCEIEMAQRLAAPEAQQHVVVTVDDHGAMLARSWAFDQDLEC